jgi:UDP-glucuronate 4-epimerase
MEEMSELYCRMYELNIVCLRFFSVYGTDCRNDLLIGQIISCVQENKSLTVFGDGNIRRDFTYIDDTLEAIFQCVKTQWKGFLVADIGTGENHSIIDVINTMNSILSKPLKVKHIIGYKEDMNISKANTENAFKYLNFRSKISLTQGLKNIFDFSII